MGRPDSKWGGGTFGRVCASPHADFLYHEVVELAQLRRVVDLSSIAGAFAILRAHKTAGAARRAK